MFIFKENKFQFYEYVRNINFLIVAEVHKLQILQFSPDRSICLSSFY